MADNCKKCGYEVKPRCGCFNLERECVEPQADAVNIDLASTHQSCDKCHKLYEKQKLTCPFCGHGWDEPYPGYIPTIDEMAGLLSPKPAASLNYVHHDPNARSILVIDLGEQCVVRVELGIYNDVWKLFCRSGHEHESTLMINEPFPAVRDAIDSQDKPLPRIERRDTNSRVDGMPVYLIRQDKDVANDKTALSTSAYNALSELAGKALPIWEGGGKWTQIYPTGSYSVNVKRYKQGEEPTLAVSSVPDNPVAIWRYTR